MRIHHMTLILKSRVVEAGTEEYVRVYSYNADGTSNKFGNWLIKKAILKD